MKIKGSVLVFQYLFILHKNMGYCPPEKSMYGFSYMYNRFNLH